MVIWVDKNGHLCGHGNKVTTMLFALGQEIILLKYPSGPEGNLELLHLVVEPQYHL